MSKNATIEGELGYNDEENFKKAKENILPFSEKYNIKIDDEEMKIIVPNNHYRNLIYHIDDIASLASSGKVVSVCFDGISKGYIDTPDNSLEIELSNWHNNYPDQELLENNFEEYVKKQSKVKRDFFAEKL